MNPRNFFAESMAFCFPLGPGKQGATPGASSAHHEPPNFLLGTILMVFTG
jgi:hypothetical protein